MIDLLLLKTKRNSVSESEFRDHLRGERLDLIVQLEGLRSYSASFPVPDDESSFSHKRCYDSVERLRFDDVETMERALSSEIAADAHDLGAPYIDFDNEVHHVLNEVVMLEEPSLSELDR